VNTKKIKTIATWVVQILLAGLFGMQAAMKLSGMPGWVERFSSWGYPENFYLLIGAFEGLGALGLLIPKFSGYSAGILFMVKKVRMNFREVCQAGVDNYGWK